jgi:NADPH:quinone reductase-like Zn-dependent oxidoreductase
MYEERCNTMKALLCKAYGNPRQLVYEEPPSPVLVGSGNVRIAVQAIGVNGVDVKHWQEPSFARTIVVNTSRQEKECLA